MAKEREQEREQRRRAVEAWKAGRNSPALLELTDLLPGEVGQMYHSVLIFQIITPEEMLVYSSRKINAKMILLSGIPTAGLTDGSVYAPEGQWRMSGTYLYGGVTTVAWLEKLNRPRQWTSDNGRYRLTAQFVSMDGEQIQLRKPDGAIISVDLRRLSEQDRLWLDGKARR